MRNLTNGVASVELGQRGVCHAACSQSLVPGSLTGLFIIEAWRGVDNAAGTGVELKHHYYDQKGDERNVGHPEDAAYE